MRRWICITGKRTTWQPLPSTSTFRCALEGSFKRLCQWSVWIALTFSRPVTIPTSVCWCHTPLSWRIAKASFKISWPVHDLAPAVHAHCNRKSAASRKATASENYWWNLLIQYYSQKQLCEPGFIALAFKSRLGPHCPGFVSVSPRSTCFTKFNEARGKPRITIDAHILVWFWYVKVYDETLYLWL